MIEVNAYQSIDGVLFDTKQACKAHENTLSPVTPFINHIGGNCFTTYNDDAGFRIIEAHDVANYVIDHIAEIINLVAEYKCKVNK